MYESCRIKKTVSNNINNDNSNSKQNLRSFTWEKLRGSLFTSWLILIVIVIIVYVSLVCWLKYEQFNSTITVSSSTISKSIQAQDWDMALEYLKSLSHNGTIFNLELVNIIHNERFAGPIGESQFGLGQYCLSKAVDSGTKIDGCINLMNASELLTILLLFMLGFFFLFFSFYFFKKKITHLLNLISLELSTIENFNLSESLYENNNDEDVKNISNLKEIEGIRKKVIHLLEEVRRISTIKVLAELATQVAHDIRSPLAALDMMMKNISILPENQRLIIRSSVSRIHDIANDLLARNRSLKTNLSDDGLLSKRTKILLPNIVNSLVSEKRTQFRDMSNISIEFDIKPSSYGLFANINDTEFSRIISNLINNSVEAIPNSKEGKIIISLSGSENLDECGCTEQILLTIKDNGNGIPAELISKLGYKGKTFGKKSGSGLGLFHARTTIESWNGTFNIESVEGIGTKIKMTLPKALPPKTFVSKISIDAKDKIIVIDDDKSIHQVWQGRFESCSNTGNAPELIHFTNPDEFIDWCFNNAEKDNVKLFLVDFEYLGHRVNGIDIIKKADIASRAILVTSRYEEEHIQSKCEDLNIKLLPKGLAGFVPIDLIENVSSKLNVNVLLDDDPLVRMIWKESAKQEDVDLKIFEKSSDLMMRICEFDKESTFYIDSNLSDNQKGETIAKELFVKGFKNLYLATGHEPEEFCHLNFLKGVIGKDPPW